MRAIRKEAEDAKRAKQAEANQRLIPIAPSVVDDGWDLLRREAAKDQAKAAKQAARDAGWDDLQDRKLALAQKDMTEREHRASEDTPSVGLTLADFRQEVTLLGIETLPSALTRSDRATLLYEGRFNTIYGETAMGKTWMAIMTVIQRLRAGRRVVWWDSEDRVTTLALRLQLLKATDLIGVPELAWITGDIHDSPLAMAEALAHLQGGNGPGLVVIDSATSFGCPSDGGDVSAWLQAYIDPWWNAGHTVLLVDHVPKQKRIGQEAESAAKRN